jgi:hypothetical protein
LMAISEYSKRRKQVCFYYPAPPPPRKRNTLNGTRYGHELYDRIDTKHQAVLTSKAIPVQS